MAAIHDPRSARALADPYPDYAALRREEPVQHLAQAGLWFLSRHADCVTLLRDDRFSAGRAQGQRVHHDTLPVSMLTADGAEHARLRAAAAPAFGPAAMHEARGWVETEVERHLDPLCAQLSEGAEVDVAADLAQPLAAALVARLLGLPAEDDIRFGAWAQAVAVNLDPFADPAPSGTAATAMDDLLDHVAEHLHARSTVPSNDALTVLAQAHAAQQLSARETLTTAGLLVVGGVEPLGDLLTNGLAVLLDQPQQATQVAGANRKTRHDGVNELLRYDAPILFAARTATQDVTLAGRRIQRGERVVALLGAANRDPATFRTPEEVALDRSPNPHLAFGAGRHTCLGAPFVRLVGEVVMQRTASALTDLQPGSTPAVRRLTVVPRGFLRLPVRTALSSDTRA